MDEDQYREEMALDEPRTTGRKLLGQMEDIPSGGAVLPTMVAGEEEPTSAAGEGELPPQTARGGAGGSGAQRALPAPGGEEAGSGGRSVPGAGAASKPRVVRPPLSRDTREALLEFMERLPSHQRFEVRQFYDRL